MKRIIILSIITGGFAMVASAQPPSADNKNMKVLSVEEANRMNGVAQPMINGKPYSQYKAEQDALKKQQVSTNAQLVAKNSSGLQVQVSSDNKQAVPSQSLQDKIASTTSKDGSNSNGTVMEKTKPAVAYPANELRSGNTDLPTKMAEPVIETKPVVQPLNNTVSVPSPDLGAVPTSVYQNNKAGTLKIEGTSLDPKFVPKQDELRSNTVDPAKTVAAKTETKTETLPAALKGTSADPDARPVLNAAKTREVNVPAQNSGNTGVIPQQTSQPISGVNGVKVAPAEKPVKQN